MQDHFCVDDVGGKTYIGRNAERKVKKLMGYDEFAEILRRVESDLVKLNQRLDAYERRSFKGRIKNFFRKVVK